jgi:hypothetical protein
MNDRQLKAAIANAPKGANVYVSWTRKAKLRAAYKGFPMFKRTTMLLRLGVDYDKMETVQQGRENGDLPATNQGLKGKKWIDFPVLKESLKTGKLLLSVKVAQVFGKPAKAKSEWFVSEAGIETPVKKADHADKLLASELKKSEVPPTFDLTGENVTAIHGVDAAKADLLADETEGEAEVE